MKRALAACVVFVAGAALAATPAAPRRGDAAAGRAKADDERCIECHVPTDPATAQPGDGLHPLLDGQSPGYLAKQMRDFRSGAREHAVMTLIARNLEDGDLADILAWYATKPWRAGTSGAAEHLYLEGDPARGVAPCAACHGGAGQGPATPETPRLAGQDAAYLAAQMARWRSGDRHNGPDGTMAAATRALGDAEIRALARGIASMK